MPKGNPDAGENGKATRFGAGNAHRFQNGHTVNTDRPGFSTAAIRMQLREHLGDAANLLSRVITGEEPAEVKDRLAAARMVLEWSLAKPAQEKAEQHDDAISKIERLLTEAS